VSLELTPEGAEAYRILRWAQEDPAGRAEQAREQVNELARPLLGSGSSQALRDVQDAGTALARLAGSLA
jgi:hypothetical protein